MSKKTTGQTNDIDSNAENAVTNDTGGKKKKAKKVY